jgi:hypothetical protein
LPEKDPLPGAEPVRNVRVQFAGEGSQQVDMRFVERGGTLSVSVRSTDETLTRNLQDHLPELNERLNMQHFQAETWMPDRGASMGFGSNGSAADAQSNSGSGFHGSGGGKQGGTSPDDGSGGQGRPQSGPRDDRPAWVRQLAALDAAAPQAVPGQGLPLRS